MSSILNNACKGSQPWSQMLAKLLIIITLVGSVVGIVGYSVDLYRHGKQKHYIGWFSGAGFVLLTIPISVRLIVQHLTNWNAPNVQKYVVRIIWMIPIYSIESWLALRFKNAAIYLETLREGYESYVIFCFMYYLIALIGDETHFNQLKSKHTQISSVYGRSNDFGRHIWPMHYVLNPWTTGSELLQNCKFGVFQYVLIKNLFAILVFTLKSSGHYSEDKLRWDEIYLYQCMVSNISQIWALYCLLMFYYATREELSHWRPVGKFLCVKSVVFFTWWQSITIDVLIYISHGHLLQQSGWTVNEISKGIQDYLICIEMFFASIAFTMAFSYKDYLSSRSKRDNLEETKPFLSAFLQSAVPDDILADIGRLANGSNQTPPPSIRRFGNSSGHGTPADFSEQLADDFEVIGY